MPKGRWSNLVYPVLSQRQREYVLGAVLGDDTLTLRRVSTHAYLRATQSLAHRDYLMWKYRMMKDHVFTPPQVIENPRYERMHWSVYFCTRTTPELTALYRLCYPRNRKTVSRQWLMQLTALSVAVWYMDDGTFAPGRNFCMLYTGAFSYDQQRLMRDYLNDRWSIDGCVIQRNREQWCLRFTRRGTQQLLSVVEPHIHTEVPSMRYKLGYPSRAWARPIQERMNGWRYAWKPFEDSVLRAEYGYVRAKHLAERLNRSVNAVQMRARKLGLKGWLNDRVSDEQGVYTSSTN